MEQITQSIQHTLKQLASDSVLTTAPLCSEVPLFNINALGDWTYLGTSLPTKFAKLFASILHCIESEYFLITPVEKVRVQVEDAPLLIIDFEPSQCHTWLDVRTSIETEHHHIDIKQMKLTEDSIYLPLERGLWGKLGRACYYNFVNEFNLSDLDEE
ncbi:DUF1285 domain-containing protein [Shewanella glacialipiscicola]|uniref:DUF1285 domain-containing protein n=1 Tax=Shewanella glacialipiscicola TaxID=614069 RepID=A0ABQ6J4F6_9GAMM|nr:DUF1285 domain-containing protein [Shewanella glacialipiscicola]MCL1084662.1 DUF1285 domain-containing protein [Shewanella glacialipiscicola]MCU7995182.1 DUF1285 domain-containing protein [Shewanella glacialipiscicola]MCU8026525.1 DUF1285 domain-containing protein [Shewanella glacialipiscicola]GIU15946.1 DUF1285 domain-containing protein [Shewanella glacialipiscicola]GMA82396.1 DUF1285 domain-containing protein [Shewanella glacialipiscicola]